MNTEDKVKHITRRVTRWINSWIPSETSREFFYAEPILGLTEYLESGHSPQDLAKHCEDLAIWHLIKYEQSALNSTTDTESLSLSAASFGYMLKFESSPKIGGSNSPISLGSAALSLSMAALAGWKDEFEARFHIILKGLNSHLLDLTNTKAHQAGTLTRHFWFILHLYATTKNLEIDTTPYSYPDSLHPYDRALENWDTTDDKLLERIIAQMANFHIINASTPKHDEIFEFDYEYTMLLPYEILAFLRIREWNGLPSPPTFDHPLMRLPLSRLPVTPAPHIHSIAEKILQKFKLPQVPGV